MLHGQGRNAHAQGRVLEYRAADGMVYFKEFDCWAKYAWTIDGGIFFHSEIYSAKDDRTVRSNTIKQLGRKASHGCVRLYRDNAKWIFDNCPQAHR